MLPRPAHYDDTLDVKGEAPRNWMRFFAALRMTANTNRVAAPGFEIGATAALNPINILLPDAPVASSMPRIAGRVAA